MDYLLTTVLLVIGVLFHIMQKIKALRAAFPKIRFKEIWGTFFSEEWDSLIVSLLVLFCYELALFICNYNEVKLPYWLDYWGMYALALVLGYAGQRLAYKYLGTAEEVLEKNADQLINKS
jgi:hypothetical protein